MSKEIQLTKIEQELKSLFNRYPHIISLSNNMIVQYYWQDYDKAILISQVAGLTAVESIVRARRKLAEKDPTYKSKKDKKELINRYKEYSRT